MTYSISDRLLYREITEPYKPSFLGKRKSLATRGVSAQSYTSVRGLYGDKVWVDDLDIVNELGGHTGCVNALSWSKSGRLLASGSDDTHVNIHTYQAESSSMPFNLATTIQTGHEANIFSVKFMPHSNDNTIVSCAGDGQVRVFDIEYAAKHATPAHISPSSIRHHSGVNLDELYRGVQFLSTSNTNARVYRSHSDRVKRIVTESSPHLFLTCSEDGEVRQWDLRLPSSAYPPHPRRGERGPPVPPPLISYKRFQLDLNSISCSGSQPHYIVLGGVHLHAFLHDRRMLGRDIDAERGSPSSSSLSGSEHDEDLMSKATKCVRRFAPNGKPKMQTNDSGHITACKISDAYPNEMIGSWSGDHIYSFNLVSSPDASESKPQDSNVTTDGSDAKKTKPSPEKKRKRGTDAAAAVSGAPAERLARDGTRDRSPDDAEDELEGDVALRVRYGNGQSEDIVLNRPRRNPAISEVAEIAQTEERALSFAHSVRRIRKVLFSPFRDAVVTAHLNESLAKIATLLPEMETACNERDYVHLSSHGGVTEAEESRMRDERQITCFFVQACGTISRLFGGTLRTTDPIQTQSLLARYNSLDIPDNIGLSHWEMFCYQLMGCIIAWLEHGRSGLLAYVKQSVFLARRLHVDANAGEEAIEEKIIPHLLDLTVVTRQQRRLINLDVNRFESDATRKLFDASRDAVTSFAAAVSESPSESSEAEKQSRHAYWGLKVVRSLLFAAAEHVDFAYVNHAFAGPRGRTEPDGGISQQDVDPDEIDDPAESVQQMSVVEAGAMDTSATGATEEGTSTGLSSGAIEDIITAQDFRAALRDHGIELSISESDGEGQNAPDMEYSPGNSDVEGTDDEEDALLNDYDEDEDDDHDNDNDDDDDDDDDEYDDDDDDEDGDRNPRSFLDASLGYARDRGRVEADVPCSTHTRVYSGHCNVKTVKDVNFYGLDDEYVVSGSDSGHLFIWDRKTGKLLNLLQGDGEVVNVIQGHPYEPMLAVSGIDHTIKIFSPDARAQERARRGLDLGTSNHRSHGVSRLQMRSRIRRHVERNRADDESRGGSGIHTPNIVDPAADAASAAAAGDGDVDDDEFNLDNERPTNGGLSTCKRMGDSYRIMSQNDADRHGGMEDAMMTRSFLAQLAVQIQTRRAAARATQGGGQAGGGGGGGDDGDGCSVM